MYTGIHTVKNNFINSNVSVKKEYFEYNVLFNYIYLIIIINNY